METFLAQNSGIIWRLVMALVLGMAIGAERVFAHKEAGMGTHAMVAMGSALFVIISEILTQKYAGVSSLDPSKIASQIVVGVGFLGAGTIIVHGSKLTGLTTAGGLWVTAGVGAAAGFGLLTLATISAVLVLLAMFLVNFLERPIRRRISGKDASRVIKDGDIGNG